MEWRPPRPPRMILGYSGPQQPRRQPDEIHPGDRLHDIERKFYRGKEYPRRVGIVVSVGTCFLHVRWPSGRTTGVRMDRIVEKGTYRKRGLWLERRND